MVPVTITSPGPPASLSTLPDTVKNFDHGLPFPSTPAARRADRVARFDHPFDDGGVGEAFA
jgi:hypothetical protein